MTGSPAYLVRLADFDDAAGIGDVHVVGWRSAYRGILPEDYLDGMSDIRHAAFWAEVLDNEKRAGATFITEAEGGDGIVGFADCGPDREAKDPAVGKIFALYVVPKWQRRGVGRTLVEACAGHLAVGGARTLVIRVLERNEGACAFYDALGGARVDQHHIAVAGVPLIEVSYRWDDIGVLAGLDFGATLVQGECDHGETQTTN